MANVCANKVVVIGRKEAVLAFVAAARGPVSEKSGGAFQTEMRLIGEVRGGKSVAEAFRDANVRIDELNGRLSSTPLSYSLSDQALLPPVSEADFSAWADDMEKLAADWSDEKEIEQSHLSMAVLFPEPEYVRQESFHLVGYNWRMSEWGCKFMEPVGEPILLDVPSFGEMLGVESATSEGDTVAVYPKFDTPNSPVFNGLLAAGAKHPELLILSSFMDNDGSEFRYIAVRAGEIIASDILDYDSLPDTCFETEKMDGEDEPMRYTLEKQTTDYLIEMAFLESEEAPALVAMR